MVWVAGHCLDSYHFGANQVPHVISLLPKLCTGVLMSPQPDQEGNKLQRPNSNFCKPLKNNSEVCPSNHFSAAATNSASDENWRPFNCFYIRVGLRTYQHPCTSSYVTLLHKTVGMRRIMTFRSTWNRIYDGVPVRL